jgi:hypothetical protein
MSDLPNRPKSIGEAWRIMIQQQARIEELQARVEALEGANEAAIDAFRNHGLSRTAQFKQMLAATEQEDSDVHLP